MKHIFLPLLVFVAAFLFLGAGAGAQVSHSASEITSGTMTGNLNINGGLCVDNDAICTSPGAGNTYIEGNLEVNGNYYQEVVSATLTSAGWYRFANSVSNAGNNGGIFEIRWARSGQHGHIRFAVGANYGYDSKIGIVILDTSYYNTDQIDKVRLLMGDTYDQMYIEFYYNGNGGDTPVYLYKYQTYGWGLITPVAGSIPSGYASYEMPTNIIFGARGDSSDIFLFDRSGNIGIGTASPTQKLTVAGRINIAGSSIFGNGVWGANTFEVHNSAWDGSSNNNYGGMTGGHGYYYGGLQSGGNGGNEASAGQLYVAGTSTLMDNVGIGTATPDGLLDVEGSSGRLVLAGGGIQVYNEINGLNSGGTAGPLYLQYDSADNLLLVNGGGYVGIGTASPSYKLDVSGDARVTGTETVGGLSAGAGGVSTTGVFTSPGNNFIIRLS
jgi:hypothetical protein